MYGVLLLAQQLMLGAVQAVHSAYVQAGMLQDCKAYFNTCAWY